MLYCLLSKVLRFVENFACWQVGIEMVLLICTDANEPWKLNTVRVSETNCCNQPKSLSGIETHGASWVESKWMCRVAINLNPYQGLKPQQSWRNYKPPYCCNQPKSLSGIETSFSVITLAFFRKVAINLNPYQGLKPPNPRRRRLRR